MIERILKDKSDNLCNELYSLHLDQFLHSLTFHQCLSYYAHSDIDKPLGIFIILAFALVFSVELTILF